LRIIIAIFVLLFATIARADQPRVFLLTMGPGDEAWELFGHNALWIHDDAENPAYNWGVFDFGNDFNSQVNFFWHFIQGRMRYWMEPFDAYRTVDVYHEWNRAVRIQELNLTPAQIEKLKHDLKINALPQNRYYTYDYYRDNCSTRVRDAIDRATGGAVSRTLKGKPTGTTYRWHTRRLSQDSPWLYVALYYILGQPVDKPIDEWQECFLPVKMSEHLHEVSIDGKPLIVGEKFLPAPNRPAEPSVPPRAWPWFLGSGLLIGIIFVLIFRWRWLFAIAAMSWSLLAGLAGMICTWGWGFTDHWAARVNENWLQLNPISIALLVLIPMAVFGRKRKLRAAFVLAGAIAFLSVIGLLMKILPMFSQVNWEIIALAIPAHVGLFVGLLELKKNHEAHAPGPDARRSDDRGLQQQQTSPTP
jgi:hypothetical protein